MRRNIEFSVKMAKQFRVVQPWGKDRGHEATLIGEHATVDEAFAHIDRLAEQMVRTGAPSDSVDLLVVDDAGRIIDRPQAH